MNISVSSVCNRIIEYSFYALLFFVPLVFTSTTSELFEFNKMWLVFALTIVIGAAWFVKMILTAEYRLVRTPLDIPIGLFLLSQIIATIFSVDVHTSLWGYYSRFNGGLLSLLAYIFLYYAFVNNCLPKEIVTSQIPLSKGKQKHHQVIAQPSANFLDNTAARIILFCFGLGILLLGSFTSVYLFSLIPDSATSLLAFRESMRNPLLTLTLLASFFFFATALPGSIVKKSLYISIIAATLVGLWGLPSHFGYDPTCLLFKNEFNVKCWTEAFVPTARIFSTLGQPNWLAAYFAIILPLTLGFSAWLLIVKNIQTPLRFVFFVIFALLSLLFFCDMVFTDSLSGLAGVALAIMFVIFSSVLLRAEGITFSEKKKPLIFLFIACCLFLIAIFFSGTTITQRLTTTLSQATQKIFSSQQPIPTINDNKNVPNQPIITKTGVTDSWKIRLNYVWPGAIAVFKSSPLIGTGVETFAYGYYLHRPIGHNLTSEWDYLYNKAHNEYLNYLATTGILGLGTYLLMIGWFLFLCLKYLFFSKTHPQSPKQATIKNYTAYIIISLVGAYSAILVSNFFGFSVVLINLYLFLIPAFVLALIPLVKRDAVYILFKKSAKVPTTDFSALGMIATGLVSLATLVLLFLLLQSWNADKSFAYGSTLYRVGEFEQASAYLHEAVKKRPGEPTFIDDLAVNDAALAAEYFSQQKATQAAQLAQEAIEKNTEITKNSPNNLIFWKSRVRLFYYLAQIEPQYLHFALDAMLHVKKLAPTDAKVSYNLAVLYGQNNEIDKGITELEKTIQLKPDYRDAYYALGLFYREKATDKEGKVQNTALQKKAEEQMEFILINFSKDDQDVKKTLASWRTNS